MIKCLYRLIFVLTFASPATLFSQIILNGDFETYTGCPTISSLDNAVPWFEPSTTPDYFNACSSDCEAGVPHNRMGTHVFAHSGDGYAGFMGYYTGSWPETREYLAVPINTPMVAGDYYEITFYARKSNRQMYASEIGANFFDSYPTQPINAAYGFIPEVESSGPLLDTVWIQIKGFHLATGNEQYFVIGNFRTNSQSTILNPPYLSANCFNQTAAYYYIDDVLIEPYCGLTYNDGHDTICAGDSLLVYDDFQLSSGVYHDTLSSDSGCDSVLERQLTVLNLPLVDINQPPKDTLCIKNGNIELNASPAGGSFSGNGVSGSEFDPNAAGLGNHYVFYSFTDSLGCEGIDSVLFYVDECLGIYQDKDTEVTIFPNPNNGLFVINLDDLKDVTISIYDLSGQLVYSEKNVNDAFHEIKLMADDGAYLVLIQSESKVYRFRIIKK